MGDGSLAFAPQWLKASQTNLRSGTQGGASSSKGNLTVMLIYSFARWWTLREIVSGELRSCWSKLGQGKCWEMHWPKTLRQDTLFVLIVRCWCVHLSAQWTRWLIWEWPVPGWTWFFFCIGCISILCFAATSLDPSMSCQLRHASIFCM